MGDDVDPKEDELSEETAEGDDELEDETTEETL